MEYETILGQVVAKANHYQAVPSKDGTRRIIKDSKIRNYEKSFCLQCRKYRHKRINYPMRIFIKVWFIHNNFDLDNSIKTILDCLQYCDAITNDNLVVEIVAQKFISSKNPRVEFAIEEIQPKLFED